MSKLSNPSLLLLRNSDEFNANSILVINSQRDGFLNELTHCVPDATIHAFSYNVADHNDSKVQLGSNSYVDHTLPALDGLDLIIYYYPKSKPEALMMLDNIRAIASKQTRLLVVGHNKGGVKSIEKQLKPFAQGFYKLDSAKHCILYEFSELSAIDNFSISNYESKFEVEINKTSFTAVSVPGVFNHGKLDVGTKLLLESIAPPYKGNVLDFGCGAGLISAFLGIQQPALKFTCLDVSALAIYAAKRTLEQYNISAKFLLSDGMHEVAGQFSYIISNPPFHTGIATDYGIAERFLEHSKNYLKSNGVLQIVANNFLKYPPILEKQFSHYNVLAKNTKFSVYQALKQ